MPNIEKIRAAVCGKRLVRSALVDLILLRHGHPCRCFIGELLHEAGYTDQELHNGAAYGYESGMNYVECFPKLQTEYELDIWAVRAAYSENDKTTVPPEKRAEHVLHEVFNTSCSPEASA